MASAPPSNPIQASPNIPILNLYLNLAHLLHSIGDLTGEVAVGNRGGEKMGREEGEGEPNDGMEWNTTTTNFF